MENIAIFVDVQNIYYTTRDAFGKHFDYNAFWRKATQGNQVVLANAYAIASNNEKQRQFHHILRGIGFQVKLKPFIQRFDGSAKGDWDVGIAIDVIETAMREDVDKIILLSGDGDFDMLAKRAIEKYRKRFEVYGAKALTADSLIEAASSYQPITDELLLS
ncbi:NYN domain-containing protein [Vibrio sp. JC009]|uniref:NYN domain-containing protein n=1 Tax=Vibrio sp. JC009 TaxID=2912314 RepID=UPI0023AF4790|nr:NYN domain-containing protein [Vibrio sp. JC009]WED23713.1 NYN domain-containing protein [Vibrio sp. JC009]